MASVSTDVLTPFNVTGNINGMVGYYVPTDGTQHVMVGTSDTNSDTLREVSWKPGQSLKQDVLTTFDVAMGPVGAYYVPEEDTQHVIVWTRVGDLIEVYWKSGQGVQQDVLATATSFTAISGPYGFPAGAAAYYVPTEGTQHVILGFADHAVSPTSGIVIEVYWKSGQAIHQDVLARFNGSFGVVGAYYFPEEGTQHVIVAAPDGNLTELYWKSGQGVTQDVLIPLENRSAAAFCSTHDLTQHVVLLADDGTLTDVYWQSGQGVHQDVLTQLPTVRNQNWITGLTGYYSANDQKRHAIVAMSDGTLTEVYW